MNFSTPLVNLEQRKALLWIRDHQPVLPPADKVAAKVRVHLLQAGLIQFDPNRKRFDPVTYVLTDAGRQALS